MLDALLRQSLAACRALSRAGYEVGVADYSDRGSIAHSRFAARRHRLPDPHGPEQPFATALKTLVDQHHYAALVASDDATLARLAQTGSPIPSCPDTGVAYTRLADKVGLADICARVRVSYPPTFEVRSLEEAERIASELGYPLVIKAARPAEATSESVREQKGATVAADRDAMISACTQLRANGLLPIIQRRIVQAEKLVIAVVRGEGISEMRFATRVIRQFPPTGGIGSALESIASDSGAGATAISALERVCDAAGYEGLAAAEAIVTPARELYLIEVNPRLWGSVWFAERLSQRAAERGIRLALGNVSLPSTAYPVGRRFHHMPSEWRWVWHRKNGRLGALFEVASSLRPWDIYDYVDFADPIPIVARLLPRR